MKKITALSFGALLSVFFVPPSTGQESSTGTTDNMAGGSNDQAPLQSIAQSVACNYLRTLSLTSWSMDLATWIANHEYKGAVDTFQGADGSQLEFEKYCFKTRIEKSEYTREFSFFDNGDYSDPKAILQQVLIFDRRTKHNEKLDEEIWKTISDSLTKMYGAPTAVPHDHLLSPFYLRAIRNEREPEFWQDSLKEIILAERYRWEGHVRTDFFMLLSREKALDSLTHRFQKLEQTYNDRILLSMSLISEMCDSFQLKKTPLNLFCQTKSSGKDRLNDLVKCGEFVSAAERVGDSVHLPFYLMALYLLGHTYSPKGNGDETGPWKDVDTLKHYNVVFEWSHLGEGWVYSEKPLINIYSKYPNSRWGQLAFILLQNTGWCLDGMCNGNNAPEVISNGEEFLKKNPESTYAAAVLLTIAKGYETNWNVSTCEIKSPYMYDQNYRYDENSRLKAIATYEQILTAYKTSTEAEIAKIRLPRLKLGINTDKTDYFFIYD